MDISLRGVVYKYTNFWYGYQERYFKLQNGVISYYLSKETENETCRKSKKLTNFTVQNIDDSLRLEIVFGEEKWSLRFRNESEFNSWRNALEIFAISTRDNVPSTSSANSSACASIVSEHNDGQSGWTGLNESDYVALRTVKSVLPDKFKSMMEMLERITSQMSESESRLQFASSVDGTSTLRTALNNCRELKQDVVYLKNVLKLLVEKVEATQKEEDQNLLQPTEMPSANTAGDVACENNDTVNNVYITKISPSHELYDQIKTKSKKIERTSAGGEERVGGEEEDEEWQDALDVSALVDATNSSGVFTEVSLNSAASDSNENLKLPSSSSRQGAKDASNGSAILVDENIGLKAISISSTIKEVKRDIDSLIPPQLISVNAIFSEIQTVAAEQLRHALAPVDGSAGWELIVTDGELRMYRMEKEGDDGITCDPMKALHSVKGISAREYIDTFFDPDLKQKWDDTLVKARLVERLHDHTVVFHQVHRRIWPSAQRESLFWSQRLDVSDYRDSDAIDAFLVCNHSTERSDVALSSSSCVRVKLKIAMLCQTVISNPAKAALTDRSGLRRDDIRCKITYVAQIHPGGWVPAAAVRQVAKTEYPKFLRNFTGFVEKQVKIRPLSV